MTASPAELRLLLLDGAIRFLEQAKAGLEARDLERAYEGFTRCQAIVMELLAALDPQHDADLCRKLSGLYTFMYTRLVHACVERDVAQADEILDLLRYERETWVMLMERLEGDRGPIAAADPAAGVSVTV